MVLDHAASRLLNTQVNVLHIPPDFHPKHMIAGRLCYCYFIIAYDCHCVGEYVFDKHLRPWAVKPQTVKAVNLPEFVAKKNSKDISVVLSRVFVNTPLERVFIFTVDKSLLQPQDVATMKSNIFVEWLAESGTIRFDRMSGSIVPVISTSLKDEKEQSQAMLQSVTAKNKSTMRELTSNNKTKKLVGMGISFAYREARYDTSQPFTAAHYSPEQLAQHVVMLYKSQEMKKKKVPKTVTTRI